MQQRQSATVTEIVRVEFRVVLRVVEIHVRKFRKGRSSFGSGAEALEQIAPARRCNGDQQSAGLSGGAGTQLRKQPRREISADYHRCEPREGSSENSEP